MKSEIPIQNKYSALRKVLASSDFNTSDKYKKLLEYIYNSTIENIPLKEATIAIDCLDKDSTYDPSIDSSVRVYLSKLRKKLEHYYLTEGISDEIELIIPKGQYHLEFRKLNRKKKLLRVNWRVYSIFTLILVLVGIFAYLLGANLSKSTVGAIPNSDIVWKEVFTGPKKTLIILGDYYFFEYSYSAQRQSYIRDVEINTDNDLNEFILDNPSYKDKIRSVYHTYLDEHIPWCISSIMPSLLSNRVQYELRLASEVQLNNINKYNIIYIGSYKTLGILKNVIGKLHFKYEVKQGASMLRFTDTSTNDTSYFDWVTNPETKARNDYAMVIKVRGPNDNTCLFFLSEHDFGNISTVNFFTDAEKIISFENQLNSDYFEALFEVRGIVRTNFDMKLLKLNQLNSNFSIDLSSTIE